MKGLVAGVAVMVVVLVGGYLWLEREPPPDPVPVGEAASEEHELIGPIPEPRPRRGDVIGRIEQLEREVESLRREVRELAAARGLAAASDADAQLGSRDLEDDPLASRVHAILEEEREAEQERRMQLRRDRWQEMNAERLDEMVEQLELSSDQREHIEGLWATEADRIMPLIIEAREGERSWQEIRESIRTIREETDREVGTMLDSEQYDGYVEMRPRGPGRRRGRAEP